jgi:hypothetical protein
MDQRILNFLSTIDPEFTEVDIELNKRLAELYTKGLIDAIWNDGDPLFSINDRGRTELLSSIAVSITPADA